MAEFITRKAIVYHIDRIIKDAKEEIVLVSPYIKADDETKKLISQTTREVAVDVIYGKEELKQNEREFFDQRSVKLSYRKDLHAKCYLNEKEAIVTSMNLYEYSQLYNDEMGILVSREDDPELYKAIHEQAMEWKEHRNGVDAPAAGRRKAGVARTQKKSPPVSQAPKKGYCIRCKADLSVAKPIQPYCDGCLASWNQFKNEEYKEKYCHICGNDHATVRLRPLCRDCHRKYKGVLEFAAS